MKFDILSHSLSTLTLIIRAVFFVDKFLVFLKNRFRLIYNVTRLTFKYVGMKNTYSEIDMLQKIIPDWYGEIVFWLIYLHAKSHSSVI